jgi:ectoine hydroxylase-related dioxygenase (phytanoyl-CoA dioxygenase family)
MGNKRESSYAINGFEILDGFYTPQDIDGLTSTLDRKGVFTYQFADADSHNLLNSISEVSELAKSEKLLSIVRNIVGCPVLPFHAIILDKTKENNWGLHWHQDLKIAVKNRIETDGYKGWSLEAGIWHVIPPTYILEQILTVRIHLDDCNSRNGSIWVIPGSHKTGEISPDNFDHTVEAGKIYDCEVKKGDIMIMSPLLLHKSPYSLSNAQRRIIHIEYRADKLDGNLEWYN